MARWKLGESVDQMRQRQDDWHKVFAFFPNRTDDGDFVWMRSYWRRRIWRFGTLIREDKVLKDPHLSDSVKSNGAG